MKKMAILRVTPETLRALLQLPDGAELVSAEMERGYRGLLKLTVDGIGWDTAEGAPIMVASAAIISEQWEGGEVVKRTVDWQLPEA